MNGSSIRLMANIAGWCIAGCSGLMSFLMAMGGLIMSSMPDIDPPPPHPIFVIVGVLVFLFPIPIGIKFIRLKDSDFPPERANKMLIGMVINLVGYCMIGFGILCAFSGIGTALGVVPQAEDAPSRVTGMPTLIVAGFMLAAMFAVPGWFLCRFKFKFNGTTSAPIKGKKPFLAFPTPVQMQIAHELGIQVDPNMSGVALEERIEQEKMRYMKMMNGDQPTEVQIRLANFYGIKHDPNIKGSQLQQLIHEAKRKATQISSTVPVAVKPRTN